MRRVVKFVSGRAVVGSFVVDLRGGVGVVVSVARDLARASYIVVVRGFLLDVRRRLL